jgi:hypothetical protein
VATVAFTAAGLGLTRSRSAPAAGTRSPIASELVTWTSTDGSTTLIPSRASGAAVSTMNGRTAVRLTASTSLGATLPHSLQHGPLVGGAIAFRAHGDTSTRATLLSLTAANASASLRVPWKGSLLVGEGLTVATDASAPKLPADFFEVPQVRMRLRVRTRAHAYVLRIQLTYSVRLADRDLYARPG